MKDQVLLLSGFGSDERLWDHQIRHLQDIADVRTIDLREQDSRNAMAEHVLRIAPERFSLAGHSLGGWVAQEVAAKAGDRIQKLIVLGAWARQNEGLVEANLDFRRQLEAGRSEEWLRKNLSVCIHPSRLHETELCQAILAMQLDCPETAYRNHCKAMIEGQEILPLLKSICCPTLLIHGREDLFFPVEECEIIHSQIAHSRMTIVEDCGHMIPLEQPQATTALMRLWLRS